MAEAVLQYMKPILGWWVTVELLGILALPLTSGYFRLVPSRGYVYSKLLGLLLASYVLWLGASVYALPNTRAGAWVSVGLAAVIACTVGILSGPKQRLRVLTQAASHWILSNWKLVFVTEALFFTALIAGIALRSHYPGMVPGEKQMELAFLNSVLNSRWFPPPDPWLAGYPMNYYYFGSVLLALLTRLTGVRPEIGYNLASGVWIALTLITAFAVSYDLAKLRTGFPRSPNTTTALRHIRHVETLSTTAKPPLRAEFGRLRVGLIVFRGVQSPVTGKCGCSTNSSFSARHEWMAIGWGLIGSVLLGVIGNLYGATLALYQLGLLPESWFRWLSLRWLMDRPSLGYWNGGPWWWFLPTGTVGNEDILGNVFDLHTEFPSVSFLIGDMHAHVLALPYLILSVAVALNLFLVVISREKFATGTGSLLHVFSERSEPLRFTRSEFVSLLITGVIGGGILFLNAWDIFPYVGLVIGALWLGLAKRHGLTRSTIVEMGVASVIVIAVAYLSILPFRSHYQSPVSGLLPNLYPTRLSHYLVMFGVFVAPVIIFLALLMRGKIRAIRSLLLVLITVAAVALSLKGAVLVLTYLQLGTIVGQGLQTMPATYQYLSGLGLTESAGLAMWLHLDNPWLFITTALLLSVCIVILIGWQRSASPSHIRDDASPDIDAFVVLLTSVALGLSLLPEILYAHDYLGSRMNTVFKFYYQVWVLFAVSATYALGRICGAGVAKGVRLGAIVLTMPLLCAALLYPVLAISTRIRDSQRMPSLDAMASLRDSRPEESAAIEWIRDNVSPSSVVLESSGDSWSMDYTNPISTFTGHPTLLGWEVHELQWRGKGVIPTIEDRKAAINQVYRCQDREELTSLLRLWQIDYVFMSGTEREKYGMTIDNAACLQDSLETVFEMGGTRVWAVPR